MVEWNLSTKGAQTPMLRTPDGFSGVSQMERVVASSPRPFVLITERELSVLRRGLTKDGWKRSLYLQDAEKRDDKYMGIGMLSIANRWLETQVQIPERGGFYHDFFCDCGNRLTVPEDLQRQDEYVCQSCGAKYTGDKYDGAVRYMRHNQLAGAILTTAIVYGIEKDKAYADKAAEMLRRYAESYHGSDADTGACGTMQQALDEAVWVIPLAQAYDLIYYSRSLSDEDKRYIEDRMFKPAAQSLMKSDTMGIWAAWRLAAVGVIGLTIKNTQLVQFALNEFRLQISEIVGEDGLWPESVHRYHFYPLEAYTFFAEACFRVGIDIFNWEVEPGKSLKMMFSAPLYCMYPSFQLPAINDGWWQSWLPVGLYEIAHRRWDDPAFAWVLKRGYKLSEAPLNSAQSEAAANFSRTSFYAFLFGRDLPGRFAAPVMRSSDFPDYGMCTLRSGDDIMLTFDYGPCKWYGHADKMSFTLYANNTLLIPDYGTPGNGSRIVDWYRDTASHNTVVVDGKSQEPASGYSLTSRYSGSYCQFAEAVAQDVYSGVRHTRKIMLVGGAVIVKDMLESAEEHDYDWFVRCEGAPTVKGSAGKAAIEEGRYPLINFDEVGRFKGAYQLDWKCENGHLAFISWNDKPDGVVGLGTCPAETAGRSASLLMLRKHGRNAGFLSVLAPAAADEEIEMHRDGAAIEVAKSDVTDIIYLRGCGDEPSNGLITDGEFAAIRLSKGMVAAVTLVGGTKVEWDGEVLVECPSVVGCIEVSFEDRSPVIRYSGGEVGIVRLKTHSRAMRVNGHRAAATSSNGHALLRVTPQLLNPEQGFRS